MRTAMKMVTGLIILSVLLLSPAEAQAATDPLGTYNVSGTHRSEGQADDTVGTARLTRRRVIVSLNIGALSEMLNTWTRPLGSLAGRGGVVGVGGR